MKKYLGILLVLFYICMILPETSTVLAGAEWNGNPVVQTRFGDVGGYKDTVDTFVWKAIPYARPPVGDLRWRAPRNPETWRGVRRKHSFSKGCTQYGVLGGINGSEDCLYLNIWRPRNMERNLPVYVWIHGGGNSMGSATLVADYYGHRLASRSQMVFVSLNYRLGPFGWLTHPALREGVSPEDDSGNYGTLDIIQALKWIRENITAFGGDPSRVMITGESAGGINVLSLLISPVAEGLFSRAICQSGMSMSRSIDEGEKRAEQVLEKLLVMDRKAATVEEARVLADDMSSAEIRSYLRKQSDRKLMRCFQAGGMGMIDNPSVFRDGYVIPEYGYETLRNGTYPNKVPLIIGSNREEYKLFMYASRSIPWKSDLYRTVAKYRSDLWKATGVDDVARMISGLPDGPPVYAYEFAWGAPDAQGKGPLPGNWGTKLGAFHSLEIPFFLGTDTIEGYLQWILYNRRNKPGRVALSRSMMEYTASFAYTGNPNRAGSSLPVWESWSNEPEAGKRIVFDVNDQTPAIGMSYTEFTADGVIAAMERELEEPLRSETLERLKRSGF